MNYITSPRLIALTLKTKTEILGRSFHSHFNKTANPYIEYARIPKANVRGLGAYKPKTNLNLFNQERSMVAQFSRCFSSK